MQGQWLLNFEGRPFEIEAGLPDLERRFLSYRPELWQASPNGGNFRFNADDGKSYSCIFLHHAKHGIFCQIDMWQRKLLDSYVTVFDDAKLAEQIVMEQDLVYPAGCFGDPAKAWEIVSRFLKTPTEIPDLPWLQRAQDVAWPEANLS